MKCGKKFLLSFLFLILFFSIGFVSASDVLEDSDYSNMNAISDGSLLAGSDVGAVGYGSLVSDSEDMDNPLSQEKANDDSIGNVLDSNEDNKEILNESVQLSSKKISTKITVNRVNTYYKEKASLFVCLKDSKNNAIKNKAVKISLNGKTYIKTTNNFGKVSLNLNLKPNRYNVNISFEGDEKYLSSSVNTMVNVKKAKLSVKTKNNISYYHPDTFFKAKVINKVTKNPVEGINVLFKVYSSKNNYKSYHSITDKNGMATLNKNLKKGFYDVYTYVRDNANRPFIAYENSKNKASLRVMDTWEMGCSSIYVHANENESAVAFRRDSTYAANLHIVVQKWHGRHAVKQYKLTGTYFFHAITTSDGWLMGTGGWDNPTVNRKIENLAGKIVSSNKMKASLLKQIRTQERKLNTGHFAIVAPDGRYAVVWRSGYIKGKLKNGEYLDVPNARSMFRHGKYKKFSKDTAKAALKIAATDRFGLNRRNIMVYHYKRTTKDFKTNATVRIYGSNDKGNLAGRSTSAKKDNVYYFKKFISKFKLSGTPNQKFLGKHNFGNIDKLFKTPTKISARNISADFNQSKYFTLNLKDKKAKKTLKNVKVNLRIYTGKGYKNYVVKTDKNGIAKFNTRNLKAGFHRVILSPANHKYMISGKSSINIKKIIKPKNNVSNDDVPKNNVSSDDVPNDDVPNDDDSKDTGTDSAINNDDLIESKN